MRCSPAPSRSRPEDNEFSVDNGAIKAVVFDLFDTLVKWEPERLPLLHWRERSTHSTLPWILPSLQERMGPRFELETFLTVYHDVIDEINAEREREGIEITCQERFERTLARLGYSDPAERSLLAFHVTRVHMDGVRKVTFAPPERSDAVRRLAPHFRLGLLSNFDDAQCGREVLLDTGVADLFEAVIISAEAGLRKPNPLIYQRILTMLQRGAAGGPVRRRHAARGRARRRGRPRCAWRG